jgi:hypothetical protein
MNEKKEKNKEHLLLFWILFILFCGFSLTLVSAIMIIVQPTEVNTWRWPVYIGLFLLILDDFVANIIALNGAHITKKGSNNVITSKPIKVGQTNRVDLKTKDFTTDDVVKDTEAHIEAVKNSCQFLEDKMHSQVEHHDYTKLGNTLPEFEYALKNDFKTNPATGVDWWKYHYMTERHHLNDNCPDDVNLIDVMEMIADCVCAGEARNGTVYPVKISPEILEKAVANTQKLLEDNIEVVPNQNKLKDVDKSNSK